MESVIPGFGIGKQPKQSGNPSTTGIQNQVPLTKNGIQYLENQNQRLSCIPLLWATCFFYKSFLFFFSLAPTAAPKTTRVPEVTPSRKVTPKPSGTTTVIVESSSNSGGQTNYTKNSKEEGIEHKSFFISLPYSL